MQKAGFFRSADDTKLAGKAGVVADALGAPKYFDRLTEERKVSKTKFNHWVPEFTGEYRAWHLL